MGIIRADAGRTVRIAYQGENKRQRVAFPLADIMEEFPGGTAVLAILRKGDTDPVPAAITEMDGTDLIWTVTAWECAKDDFIYAQITYAVDEVVAKTKTYRFDVKGSLIVSAAEPETWQDMVGQLVTAAAALQAAIDAYDAMTAEAEGLAAGSAPTAEIDHTGDTPVLKLGIPAGATGAKGDKGDTGAKGDKGDTGAKGDKGDTGATGAQGPKGDKGDKGDTGSQGPAGPKGDKGDPGDPGDLIDDTAGVGDTDKTFSADKLATDHSSLLNAITSLDNSKAPVIIDSASGAIATFPDGADGLPLGSLVVGIEPVQASGTPSPENPLPITGWTGCNVTRCGKNLFDMSAYTPSNLTFETDTDTTTRNGIRIDLPEGTYTLSGNNTTIPTYIYFVIERADGSNISRSSLSGTGSQWFDRTITLSKGDYIILYKANTNGVLVLADVLLQIEVDSTKTDYEAYQGTTYPITWQTEAGTVYGGTVNPVTGKLIVTHGYKDLGTLSWLLVDSTNHVFNASIPEGAYSIAVNETMSGACSSYAIVKANQFASVADNSFFQGWQGFYKNKWNIKDTAQSDVSAFQTAMSGVMLAYPLAEPLEYDLTPIEITTLFGYNAIFADTGDVAVDYRADTRLFVEKTEVSGVQDVKVNGSSVVTDGVANVPVAGSQLGVAKYNVNYGVQIQADGTVRTASASSAQIKAATEYMRVIVPENQHEAAFYGLAKVAGDSTQKSSSNAVGTYTESAKSSISQMLDAPETISGTTPSITAKAGVRYVCGEVSTLTIVAPASGCIDVTFVSGSTPTVLTVTPPTGLTMKWANGFDPSSLDANTTYEINIMDGCLGVVGQWT